MADNCVDRGENAVRSNHSIDLLSAALVAGRNVQVTFTRDGRQLTVNLNNYNWTDPGGGGSLGTWHYTTNAQEAWKVFAGTSAMATLQGYYQRATAAQLPMGNMSPLLVRAQVTDSNQIPARTTEGLLVITEWFNGTFFQQSKVNRLTAALNRENISHNRNDVDCQRWGTHHVVSRLFLLTVYLGLIVALGPLELWRFCMIARVSSGKEIVNQSHLLISIGTRLPTVE